VKTNKKKQIIENYKNPMNMNNSLKKFLALTVMTVIAASAAMGQISTKKNQLLFQSMKR